MIPQQGLLTRRRIPPKAQMLRLSQCRTRINRLQQRCQCAARLPPRACGTLMPTRKLTTALQLQTCRATRSNHPVQDTRPAAVLACGFPPALQSCRCATWARRVLAGLPLHSQARALQLWGRRAVHPQMPRALMSAPLELRRLGRGQAVRNPEQASQRLAHQLRRAAPLKQPKPAQRQRRPALRATCVGRRQLRRRGAWQGQSVQPDSCTTGPVDNAVALRCRRTPVLPARRGSAQSTRRKSARAAIAALLRGLSQPRRTSLACMA